MSLNTILATTPLTSTGYHLKATGTTIGNSLIWDNGTNVGIGNTNTSYTLDVSGTGRFTSSLTSDTLLVNATAQANVTALIQGKVATAGTALKVISDGNGTDKVFEFTGADGVAAQTMTMLQSGNVGIGITTPSAKLDLGSNFGTAGTINKISLYNTGTTPTYGFGISAAQLDYVSVNDHVFYTGATLGERMRITSGGDILFGFAKYFQWSADTSAAATRSWGIRNNETADGDFAIKSSSTNNNTLNTTRLVITSGGNVGIGMTGYSDMRLVVRGAGTSSATFGLRIEDSSANVLFQVRNDGLYETGTRALSPYNYGVTAGPVAVFMSNAGSLGYNASIRESKINIVDIENVDWLKELKAVNFNKRKIDEEGNYLEEFENELHYGLIAEDVQEVNSDLVFRTNDGKLKGVHYDRLIVPILKLVQEQQAQIEELKAEIDELKNK
jgi:hypothetical protein